MSEVVGRLGDILEWPGGFAMSLGAERFERGVVRCCEGHPTPEEAKHHGLARVVEVVLAAADRDIAEWAKQSAGPDATEGGGRG